MLARIRLTIGCFSWGRVLVGILWVATIGLFAVVSSGAVQVVSLSLNHVTVKAEVVDLLDGGPGETEAKVRFRLHGAEDTAAVDFGPAGTVHVREVVKIEVNPSRPDEVRAKAWIDWLNLGEMLFFLWALALWTYYEWSRLRNPNRRAWR